MLRHRFHFYSGFLCIRYPKFLLEEGARDLYQRVLSPTYASVKLKLQVIAVVIKYQKYLVSLIFHYSIKLMMLIIAHTSSVILNEK